MTNIRITKEFSFECAHSLYGYDGKCSRIHGHSYKFFVTLKGASQDMSDSPKDGMLVDFTDLKSLVTNSIIEIFDHSLVLAEGTPLSEELAKVYDNVIILPFRPTTENLLGHFSKILLKEIGSNPRFKNSQLFSLRLHETATSYAEWFAEDNL